MRRIKTLIATTKLTGFAFLLVLSSLGLSFSKVEAVPLLSQRFDKMASSVKSEVTLHQVGFTMTETTTPVGSIGILFCSNTPILQDPCTVPSGFSASAVNLNAQTGDTGFSIHPNTTANRIVLTRPATNPTGVLTTFDFDNITNPDTNGTYFLRIQTYSSNDGTGPDVQNGGIVIYINNALSVSGEVPPYLTFCVAVSITAFDCSTANNFFIDFGNLLTTVTSHATSQFVVASNAASGYSVTMSGTTLTSGLNTIPALTVPTSSVTGTGQFGLNLRQNTTPSDGTNVVGPGTASPTANYDIPNQYVFNNGDIIASVNHSDDIRKFTANYITNVNSAQPGGVYATTISFICLANF